MKILIVAPKLSGIDQAELPEVAQGNEVSILHGTVTVSHLEMALRSTQFDAIHCMQHGSYGVLEMSDRSISEERFALALAGQKSLRFVFLNACNSAGVASRVHNVQGTSVIFHEAPISDPLAVRLTSEFYNNLASGVILQKALDDANTTVAREARAQATKFVEAHLINNSGTPLLTEKLDRLFSLMSSQLEDIDNRLADVEGDVKRLGHPQYLSWMLLLLAVLVIVEITTAALHFLIAP